ncbi:MAG: hypothetical protein JWP75_2553 [Frondihabitans sp.]|nr:hypothetical protein [Frondihabitans sp.]
MWPSFAYLHEAAANAISSSTLFSDHPDLLSYKNIGAETDGLEFGDGGPPERCFPVDITETNMSGADPGPIRLAVLLRKDRHGVAAGGSGLWLIDRQLCGVDLLCGPKPRLNRAQVHSSSGGG